MSTADAGGGATAERPTPSVDDAVDASKPGRIASGDQQRRSGRRQHRGIWSSLFGCASASSARRAASPPTPDYRPPLEVKPNGNSSSSQQQQQQQQQPPQQCIPAVKCEPIDPSLVYNMRNRRRGMALVFNFQRFKFSKEFNLTERHGSDKDADNIVASLKSLQFEVHRHNNLTAEAFVNQLMEVTSVDHSESDAIAIVIMSHGEEGVIFAHDCQVSLADVFEPFRRCESLVGKPKLFFIQACRGNKFDTGMEMTDGDTNSMSESEAFNLALEQTDGIKSIQRLPTDSDFLICYSVVPGYFSWRNASCGSWFIQKLTEVLANTDCSKVDLLRIMTRVNRAVAYDFESRTSRPDMDRKKQVPSIVSMLTKELYFPPK